MNRNTIKEKYKSKEKKTQKGKIEKKNQQYLAAIFLSFCSLSKYLSFFFFINADAVGNNIHEGGRGLAYRV